MRTSSGHSYQSNRDFRTWKMVEELERVRIFSGSLMVMSWRKWEEIRSRVWDSSVMRVSMRVVVVVG